MRSQKVTGPSFTRLTCMSAPKRPVCTRGDQSCSFSTKRLKSRSARRRRRAREARTQAARGVGGKGELRHGEDLASHVLERQVHLARAVGEDAIARTRSARGALRLGVAALDADERTMPAPMTPTARPPPSRRGPVTRWISAIKR